MTSSEEVNITTTLIQVTPLQTDVAVFLASLGNALILNVLPKVTSLHSPTKLLFGNLAVTDLCVGLISQPLFVTIRLSAVIKMDLDIQYQGRIQDFFLGGGALVSCSTSTPINHIVFFFFAEYQLY